MYERIQRTTSTRTKKDISLVPHILLVVIIATVLIVPFAYMGRMMYRYQEFKQDLAESMAYAEMHGTLSGDDADRFFSLIVDAGMGKPQNTVPGVEGVRYEFGDSSTLELWSVDIDGDPENPGTLLRYTRADGDVFCYDTDKIDYHLAIDTLDLR